MGGIRWAAHAVGEAHALVEPRATAGCPRCAFEELPTDAPAAVAALYGVHPAGGVAAVGVIVAGEESAELVEGEFLWVAKAVVENLETGAIEFAAVDCAGLGRVQLAPVEGGDGGGAVADAEINPAIGAKAQPVQVVPEEADAHAEPGGEALAGVGDTVVVAILEQPKVREVGKPNLAVTREHTGGETVGGRVEAVGKHRGVVEHAVAVGVAESAKPVGVVGEAPHLVALVHGEHVAGALGCQFLVEPVHVLANIGDAFVKAETFDDVKVAVLVDVERDWVGQQRLGGGEAD